MKKAAEFVIVKFLLGNRLIKTRKLEASRAVGVMREWSKRGRGFHVHCQQA